MLSIATVLGRSAAGAKGSLAGYSGVLNRVLIKVDLPRPDSPEWRKWGVLACVEPEGAGKERTDDHGGELETFSDAFSMHLVGKIGEAHVAHQLFADDG